MQKGGASSPDAPANPSHTSHVVTFDSQPAQSGLLAADAPEYNPRDYAGYVGAAKPEPPSILDRVEPLAAAIALAIVVIAAYRWRKPLRAFVGDGAAAIAGLGVIIVAASITVVPKDRYSSEIFPWLIAHGWLTFFGVALFVIGALRWINRRA